MAHRHVARIVAAMGLAVPLAACGTTVHNVTDGLSTGAVSGLAGPADMSSALGSDGGRAGSTTTPTSLDPGAPDYGTPAGTGDPGNVVPTAPTPTRGNSGNSGPTAQVLGVEDGVIKVGVVHLTNADEAYAAIGAPGLAGADPADIDNAIVDDINKHGGVLGLEIKLVEFKRDANDQTTPNDTWQQRECAHFTEDNHVFAMLTGEGDVLDACAAKNDIVEVCGPCAISTFDDVQMARAPMLFEPSGAAVNRVVDFYVDGLARAGFFKGSLAKIGLLAFDTPVYVRQYSRLVAALRQRGLTLTDHAFLKNPNSTQDNSTFLSGLSNAELKFKSEGINRVLVFDGAGVIMGYGMQAADRSGWRPHWGLNSTSPAAAALDQGLLPESQREGLTMTGWVPAADKGFQVKDTQRPPGLSHCLAVLKTHGITVTSNNSIGAASFRCDSLYFLRDALVRAGAVSVDAFRQGAGALGTSFATAAGYGTRWSGPRRDGASIYRITVYTDSCGCFKYWGRPQAMP